MGVLSAVSHCDGFKISSMNPSPFTRSAHLLQKSQDQCLVVIQQARSVQCICLQGDQRCDIQRDPIDLTNLKGSKVHGIVVNMTMKCYNKRGVESNHISHIQRISLEVSSPIASPLLPLKVNITVSSPSSSGICLVCKICKISSAPLL